MRYPANRVVAYGLLALVVFFGVDYWIEHIAGNDCAGSECVAYLQVGAAVWSALVTLVVMPVVILSGSLLPDDLASQRPSQTPTTTPRPSARPNPGSTPTGTQTCLL
jgi:hypothetical protein